MTPSSALPRAVSCSTHGSVHAPPTAMPRGDGLSPRLSRRCVVARRGRHEWGESRAAAIRRLRRVVAPRRRAGRSVLRGAGVRIRSRPSRHRLRGAAGHAGAGVRRRRGRVRRPGRRLPARRRRPRRQPPHDLRVPRRHQRARRRTRRRAATSSGAPAAPAPSTRPAASISASASATATSIRCASSMCAISPSWSGSSPPTICRPSHGTRGVWSPGRSPRVDQVSQPSPAISPVRSAMLAARPSTPGAAVGKP